MFLLTSTTSTVRILQNYKQPPSHGVLEAYNSLDKAQNRKLNRQDNRSWISFAVQKSQLFLFPTFAFFFTDFYERFNFLSLRHLSKIDPLRHARPLTAVFFWLPNFVWCQMEGFFIEQFDGILRLPLSFANGVVINYRETAQT